MSNPFSKPSGGGQATVPTSQTQTSEPWAAQKPYLESGFERAEDLFNSQQPTFYPGQTYVDQSPQGQLALQLTENRALAGSPIQEAGQQQYMDTVSGANLYDNPGFNLMSPFATGNFSTPGTGMITAGGMGQNQADQYLQGTAQGDYTEQGNPYLSNVTESLANRLQPQVASRFAASGRSGSGAEASEFTSRLADAVAPYEFGAYGDERGRQLQAAGMLQGTGESGLARMMGAGGQLAGVGAGERQTQLGAAGGIANLFGAAQNQQYNTMMGAPAYAQQDYNDYGRLAGVGDAYRNEEQLPLSQSIAQHDFYANQPYQKLAQYMGLLGGSYGGTTSSTGTMPNPAYGSNTGMQNLMGLGQLGIGAYGISQGLGWQ